MCVCEWGGDGWGVGGVLQATLDMDAECEEHLTGPDTHFLLFGSTGASPLPSSIHLAACRCALTC